MDDLDSNDAKRKQVEIALRESEAKYRHLIENSLQGIAIFQDARFVYANPAMNKITGYSVDELLAMSVEQVSKMVHPDDYPKIMSNIQKWTSGLPAETRYEFRLINKDGHVRILETYESLITYEGKPAIQSAVIDITERRQVEIALRESEGRLRQAMNLTRLGIWEWDIETDRTTWTGDIFRMYGITPEEFTGKGSDYLDFTHPEDRQMQRDNISGAFEHGIKEDELAKPDVVIPNNPKGFRILRRDGTICHVLGDAVAVLDSQGKAVRMVGVLQDITELKLAEEARLENKRVLTMLKTEQEWNASIQRMIKVLSHELRTPLAVIQFSSDILRRHFDQMIGDKELDRLETIASKVQQMTQTINDVVQVVQNAFNHDIFSPTLIDLEQICCVTLNELQATVGAKHKLIFVTDGTIKTAYADEKLITRILINLLSNAIKYSPPASEIRLELHYKNGITISVVDYGMGISEEDQPRIFESFFRTANVESIHGTGLGLSIVRDCVELHKGQITVESQLGVGSTFKVWLPLEIGQAS